MILGVMVLFMISPVMAQGRPPDTDPGPPDDRDPASKGDLRGLENALSRIEEKLLRDSFTMELHGTDYRPGERGRIFLQLKDSQGFPENEGSCLLDLYYPFRINSTADLFITNAPMLHLGGSNGLYFYDIATIPDETGIYMMSAGCNAKLSSNFVYETTGADIFSPFRTNTTGTYYSSTLALNSYTDFAYTRCESSSIALFDLGGAADFGALSGAAIAGTGHVEGDIGAATGTIAVPITTNGTKYAIGDPIVLDALVNYTAAYNVGLNLTYDTQLSATIYDFAGQNLTSGIYNIGTAATTTGVLTFDGGGNPDATFVIQVGTSLDTTLNVGNMILINGAQAKNIFWIVEAAITIGANTNIVGTFLGGTAMTFGSNTTLSGRALMGQTGGTITLATTTISEVGDSSSEMCQATYHFDTTVHFSNTTNITDLSLFYMGEASTTAILTFEAYNYSANAFHLLPNNLIFSGLAVGGYATGVNDFSSNAIPPEDFISPSGNITIRLTSSAGSNFDQYNNWLNINLRTESGLVQALKGSGEIHINDWFDFYRQSYTDSNWENFTGTINQNILDQFGNQTASDIWNFPERNLTTFVFDNTNYSLIAEVVWNYNDTILTNILTQISNAIWTATNRSLTEFDFTVNTTINLNALNATDIAEAIWLYQGNVSSNLITTFGDYTACVVESLLNPGDGWGVQITECPTN